MSGYGEDFWDNYPSNLNNTNVTLWAALAGVSFLGARTAAFFTFRKKKEGGKHER